MWGTTTMRGFVRTCFFACVTNVLVRGDGDCWITPDSKGHVNIPDNTTKIPDSAFLGCRQLVSVTFPVTGLEEIGASAFGLCTKLESVDLPDTVATIGGGAFQSCAALTTVTIPEGVGTINSSVFLQCVSLVTVSIPSTVTSIDSYAFYGCTSLLFVDLPPSVEDIGGNAFAQCPSLVNVTVPASVHTIGSAVFPSCYGYGLEVPGLQAPRGVVVCEPCFGREAINLWDNVTSIGDAAFSGCASISLIRFPTVLTYIGPFAFESCWSLSTVSFPQSLTRIGTHAFYNCDQLSNVTIPDNVTIELDAFARCGCDESAYVAGVRLCNCQPLTATELCGPSPNRHPTGQPLSAPLIVIIVVGAVVIVSITFIALQAVFKKQTQKQSYTALVST